MQGKRILRTVAPMAIARNCLSLWAMFVLSLSRLGSPVSNTSASQNIYHSTYFLGKPELTPIRSGADG